MVHMQVVQKQVKSWIWSMDHNLLSPYLDIAC